MEFENLIQKVGEDVVSIVQRKNRDYGNSFEEIFRKYGMVSLLIRLHDKLNRLENLSLRGLEPQTGESVEDTLRDIAGYSLLALAIAEKDKLDYEQLC